jgi:hypothetical protein
VNPILFTLDLGTPLDRVLPHVDIHCVTRYELRQGFGEEEPLTLHKGEGRRKEEEERRRRKKKKEEEEKREEKGGRHLHLKGGRSLYP